MNGTPAMTSGSSFAPFSSRQVLAAAAADELHEIDGARRAYDVNNAGQVTGIAGGQAFRWTLADGMELLGPLDGRYQYTAGFAINQSGIVVGEATNPTNDEDSRAFIYSDNAGMQAIPPIGLINAAGGVNRFNHVVGSSQRTGFGDRGWLGTPEDGIQQLDQFIDPELRMAIIMAFDINDPGQIAALAFDNTLGEFVGVVLTPAGRIDCGLVHTFAVTCRRGRLRGVVKSGLPEGTVLHLTRDGVDTLEVTINARGKGAARWRNQSGMHEVCINECPEIACGRANCG